MADFTQNISNTVRCFGPANSTKWGQAAGVGFTMTWGTTKWGEDGVLVTRFQKVIGIDAALTFSVSEKRFSKVFDLGSFNAAFESDFESLKNGNWFYVFPDNTIDADERSIATWSEVSANDATFTCQAAGSTSWSSGA